jgi:hypothetical protein
MSPRSAGFRRRGCYVAAVGESRDELNGLSGPRRSRSSDPAGGGTRPTGLLWLQGAAGNRATTDLIRQGSGVQRHPVPTAESEWQPAASPPGIWEWLTSLFGAGGGSSTAQGGGATGGGGTPATGTGSPSTPETGSASTPSAPTGGTPATETTGTPATPGTTPETGGAGTASAPAGGTTEATGSTPTPGSTPATGSASTPSAPAGGSPTTTAPPTPAGGSAPAGPTSTPTTAPGGTTTATPTTSGGSATGTTSGAAPTGAAPAAPTTLTSGASYSAYAAAALPIKTSWSTYPSADARGQALGQAAVTSLTTIGVHPPTVTMADLPAGNGGNFGFPGWTLTLARLPFAPTTVTDAIFDNPYTAVYHEARHCEQWFRMAQLRAGAGKTAAEIRTAMGIDASAASAAAAKPLAPGSTEAAEAQTWWDSVYGTGASARNATLNEVMAALNALNSAKSADAGGSTPATQTALTQARTRFNTAYAAYRALPEEADAFGTEAALRTALTAAGVAPGTGTGTPSTPGTGTGTTGPATGGPSTAPSTGTPSPATGAATPPTEAGTPVPTG